MCYKTPRRVSAIEIMCAVFCLIVLFFAILEPVINPKPIVVRNALTDACLRVENVPGGRQYTCKSPPPRRYEVAWE